MKFQTKKELLRYLWKNEDDRKLITRMIARGEVVVENRMYIIEDKAGDNVEANADDLEYLNREYEKLEWLLDYSLRRCYNIMKKRGIISSEDTYDNFYEKITEWYTVGIGSSMSWNVAERGSERGSDLNDIVKKFNIWKASDFIS